MKARPRVRRCGGAAEPVPTPGLPTPPSVGPAAGEPIPGTTVARAVALLTESTLACADAADRRISCVDDQRAGRDEFVAYVLVRGDADDRVLGVEGWHLPTGPNAADPSGFFSFTVLRLIPDSLWTPELEAWISRTRPRVGGFRDGDVRAMYGRSQPCDPRLAGREPTARAPKTRLR